eukprot:gene2165-4214_t
MLAAFHRNGALCRLLVQLGANTNIRNHKSQNAAIIARSCGWKNLADWLAKKTGAGSITGIETYADLQYDRALRYTASRMKDIISHFGTTYLSLVQGTNSHTLHPIGPPSHSKKLISESGQRAIDHLKYLSETHYQIFIQKNVRTIDKNKKIKDELDGIQHHKRAPLPSILVEELHTKLQFILDTLKEGNCTSDIEASKKPIPWTPLMCAVALNEVIIMRRIIREGADINYQNSLGTTPLMLAAQLNNIEALVELLVMNAHIDTIDHEGYTALAYASTLPLPAAMDKTFLHIMTDGKEEYTKRICAEDFLRMAIKNGTAKGIRELLEKNTADTSEEARQVHDAVSALMESRGLTVIDSDFRVKKDLKTTSWRLLEESDDNDNNNNNDYDSSIPSFSNDRIRRRNIETDSDSDSEVYNNSSREKGTVMPEESSDVYGIVDVNVNDVNSPPVHVQIQPVLRCPKCTLPVPCTHFYTELRLKRYLKKKHIEARQALRDEGNDTNANNGVDKAATTASSTSTKLPEEEHYDDSVQFLEGPMGRFVKKNKKKLEAMAMAVNPLTDIELDNRDKDRSKELMLRYRGRLYELKKMSSMKTYGDNGDGGTEGDGGTDTDANVVAEAFDEGNKYDKHGSNNSNSHSSKPKKSTGGGTGGGKSDKRLKSNTNAKEGGEEEEEEEEDGAGNEMNMNMNGSAGEEKGYNNNDNDDNDDNDDGNNPMEAGIRNKGKHNNEHTEGDETDELDDDMTTATATATATESPSSKEYNDGEFISSPTASPSPSSPRFSPRDTRVAVPTKPILKSTETEKAKTKKKKKMSLASSTNNDDLLMSTAVTTGKTANLGSSNLDAVIKAKRRVRFDFEEDDNDNNDTTTITSSTNELEHLPVGGVVVSSSSSNTTTNDIILTSTTTTDESQSLVPHNVNGHDSNNHRGSGGVVAYTNELKRKAQRDLILATDVTAIDFLRVGSPLGDLIVGSNPVPVAARGVIRFSDGTFDSYMKLDRKLPDILKIESTSNSSSSNKKKYNDKYPSKTSMSTSIGYVDVEDMLPLQISGWLFLPFVCNTTTRHTPPIEILNISSDVWGQIIDKVWETFKSTWLPYLLLEPLNDVSTLVNNSQRCSLCSINYIRWNNNNNSSGNRNRNNIDDIDYIDSTSSNSIDSEIRNLCIPCIIRKTLFSEVLSINSHLLGDSLQSSSSSSHLTWPFIRDDNNNSNGMSNSNDTLALAAAAAGIESSSPSPMLYLMASSIELDNDNDNDNNDVNQGDKERVGDGGDGRGGGDSSDNNNKTTNKTIDGADEEDDTPDTHVRWKNTLERIQHRRSVTSPDDPYSLAGDDPSEISSISGLSDVSGMDNDDDEYSPSRPPTPNKELTAVPFSIASGHYVEAERLLRVSLGVGMGVGVGGDGSEEEKSFRLFRTLCLQADMYKLMGLWPLAMGLYLDAVELITSVMGYGDIRAMRALCVLLNILRQMDLPEVADAYFEKISSRLEAPPANPSRRALLKKLEAFTRSQNRYRLKLGSLWTRIQDSSPTKRGEYLKLKFTTLGMGGLAKILSSTSTSTMAMGFLCGMRRGFLGYCVSTDRDSLGLVAQFLVQLCMVRVYRSLLTKLIQRFLIRKTSHHSKQQQQHHKQQKINIKCNDKDKVKVGSMTTETNNNNDLIIQIYEENTYENDKNTINSFLKLGNHLDLSIFDRTFIACLNILLEAFQKYIMLKMHALISRNEISIETSEYLHVHPSEYFNNLAHNKRIYVMGGRNPTTYRGLPYSKSRFFLELWKMLRRSRLKGSSGKSWGGLF